MLPRQAQNFGRLQMEISITRQYRVKPWDFARLTDNVTHRR